MGHRREADDFITLGVMLSGLFLTVNFTRLVQRSGVGFLFKPDLPYDRAGVILGRSRTQLV